MSHVFSLTVALGWRVLWTVFLVLMTVACERFAAHAAMLKGEWTIGCLAGGVAHDFNNVRSAARTCTIASTTSGDHPGGETTRNMTGIDGLHRGVRLARRLLFVGPSHALKPVVLKAGPLLADIPPSRVACSPARLH